MTLKAEIIPETYLDLAEMLIKEAESLTYKPYHDSAGKLTIGYGRNLESRGITFEEARMMLTHDLIDAHNELSTQLAFFKDLNSERKAVLCDMVYNMGLPGLLSFKKMLTALQHKNFDDAAKEIKDSQYWEQTGERALRNYCMMKFGRRFTKVEAQNYFSD